MSLSQRNLREVSLDLKLNNLDLNGNTTEFKTLPTRPRLHRYVLFYIFTKQRGNLPPLCKNIAGGWTQNVISIIFAKYRLVSEVLGIWFLRRAISNFVHNFLLISVKDWYSCQLRIFRSDDIVCWSKFPNFDMWVGCQNLSAILNLRLIEY